VWCKIHNRHFSGIRFTQKCGISWPLTGDSFIFFIYRIDYLGASVKNFDTAIPSPHFPYRQWLSGNCHQQCTQHSASYLSYSGAGLGCFWGFCGVIHCTDGAEIWCAGCTFGPLIHANFTSIGAKMRVWNTQKLNMFLNFYKILEYKCPAEANPLCNFYEICRGCR